VRTKSDIYVFISCKNHYVNIFVKNYQVQQPVFFV
jgi:predicted transcriptional regulator of viral defense system